ncbi:mannan endo-1,4-beta-mannosidase [Hymenobacter sp. BT18]|uniref:glycosyl hydrolase n=1 Tax=Hymenobacter sp. BT18 TaxID=2835648 RepID=UPI00143EB310|nr:glycosyl hydrolase [Hymenobacter sp. BT18]QIX60121.1 mannan endo-1,4-beta-mannosidase [Hymenobacter sp. BT18]
MKRIDSRQLPHLFLFALLTGFLTIHPLVLRAAPPIRLEAEQVARPGQLLQAIPGYSGTGYAGNFTSPTDSLTFHFKAVAGTYDLTVHYSSPFGTKEYFLAVNKARSGYFLSGPTVAFTDSKVGRFALQAGENTITVASGWGYFNIDYIELTPSAMARAGAVPLLNGRAEAELGGLNGVQTAVSPTGFSGTGFVTGFDAAADNVSITFDNPVAGLYKLQLGYTSPFGDKGYDLQVNGEKSTGMFTQTGDNFKSAEAGTYLLPKGLNTVTIGRGWGYFGIDYLQLSATTVALPAAVPNSLVDEQATPATKALLGYLRSQYGSKVLAGQHAGPEDNLADLQYIVNKTGKEPALASFDFIEYSPSRRANGSNPTGYTEQFIRWSEKSQGRGIVSMMWHWNAPTDLLNTPDKPWWMGFYTDGTTFDIAAVLADRTGTRYQLLLQDMDAIAEELKKFQAANIPVLWRPLHEAEGKWFWWGAKGAGPYKELWRVLYDRLTNHHQLHNLIWVYGATQSPGNDWYPGDAYVDIAGVDLYVDVSANMSSDWNGLQQQFGGRKLVALTESGNLPDPDKIRGYGTWWSWFTVWQGKDWIQKQPLDLLKRVYADADVITLDELPDWKGAVTSTRPGQPARAALSVYPNPASGYSLNANISLPASQPVTIRLTNSVGQQLWQQQVVMQAGSNTFQVPIHGLRMGLYQLTVLSADWPPTTQRVLIR